VLRMMLDNSRASNLSATLVSSRLGMMRSTLLRRASAQLHVRADGVRSMSTLVGASRPGVMRPQMAGALGVATFVAGATLFDSVRQLTTASAACAAEYTSSVDGVATAASGSQLTPPPARTVDTVRLGLVQMSVCSDKLINIASASSSIRAAVAHGARMIMLPEMFNCPYSNASFAGYSETMPIVGAEVEEIDAEASPTSRAMAELAKKYDVYIVAGSIPERALPASSAVPKNGLPHDLYNTCLVYSPEGRVIAKHRKVHLFDIDVPGKMTFRESDSLSAGQSITYFDAPFGRVGVGICYDLRFGEYAQVLAEQAGATMLVYPGAFNTTTGPMHWELLQRARAVDNQLWVATCSPARSEDLKAYQAWGHSSVVSPWGKVVATTDHAAGIVIADVDMNEVEEMRRNIPVRTQKRDDVYKLTLTQKGTK
jgi:omega-amidase